ncbi:MAG: NAD(P)H-binding protein [Parvularculaceae bacterium]
MTTDRANRLAGRTVLVAGATGFIGSRIAIAASAEGAHVKALSRSGSPGRLKGEGRIELVRGDLRRPHSLKRAFESCTGVVNAAFDFLSPAADQIGAFENLVGAAKAAGVKAFIQISSIAVYDGWPNDALTENSAACGSGSDYKSAKCAMERFLASADIPYAILQPTIVYGSGGWQWTDRLFEELTSGAVILPDDPRGICNAVHVDDVAEAAVCALALKQQRNRSYIISGPSTVEWAELYAAYASIAGVEMPTFESFGNTLKTPLSPVSPRIVQRVKQLARHAIGEGGLSVARKTIKRLRGRAAPQIYRPSGSMLELYRSRGACSIERARLELGYVPQIDLQEGLERIRKAYGS